MRRLICWVLGLFLMVMTTTFPDVAAASNGRTVQTGVTSKPAAGARTLTDPFILISAGLPNLRSGCVAWGDYDNDGKLDVLITGQNAGSAYISKIFHNDNGTFTDINAGLQGVAIGQVAWGDYDNDGFLDIILTGTNGSPVTKIYRNNGNGTFTDININLPGVFYSAVAWGDYDNDGYLDIFLAGSTMSGSSTAYISKIFHNNGNGTFTDIGASLTNMNAAAAAWGDYDNDGFLDLVLTGMGWMQTAPASKIYHNNGNGTFTDSGISLLGLYYGTAVWGDYDNDGYLDLLLTGLAAGNTTVSSMIYHNKGNSTFEAVSAGLTGVVYGTAAWGDYDNDGYLDLVLAGNTAVNGNALTSIIYHNNANGTFNNIGFALPGLQSTSVAWGDFNNDGYLDLVLSGVDSSYACVTNVYQNNEASLGRPANTAPNQLSGIQASSQDGIVTLSWPRSTDAQTPQNGLNYNVYVGKTASTTEIISPMAQMSNGWRRVCAMGAQNKNISWKVNDLAPGLYYWGVQAVDTGFKGAAFASSTFNFAGSSISGTITFSGAPLAGVALLVNGKTAATTDAAGQYSFSRITGWNGTVTPIMPEHTFTPPTKAYTGLSSNQTAQDYNGSLVMYKISGVVKLYGVGVPGVSITVDGVSAVTTDANGAYFFMKPSGWSGTATPANAGYTFTPLTRTYTNLLANQDGQDYTSAQVMCTISGTVKFNGVALAGVAIYNSGNVIATTDANGVYTFQKPYGWSGVETPVKAGYTFTPATRPYSSITGSLTAEDYTAAVVTQTISGKIISSGAGLAGVSLLVNGNAQTTTDANGAYVITVDRGSSGIVQPVKIGYAFTPESRPYNNITSNWTDQNYTPSESVRMISGTVTLNTAGMPGVTMLVDGVAVTTTDANGAYHIPEPNGWSGTVALQKSGYVFTPATKTYANVTADQTAQDYIGAPGPYIICGTIKVYGVVLPGVSIIADNIVVATTDANGVYSFTKPSGWSGTVTPQQAGHAFVPVSQTYSNLAADQTGQDYAAWVLIHTISGTVSYNGAGLAGVSINISGSTATTTNANGTYSFPEVYGWSGTVNPFKTGFSFTPASQTYPSLEADLTGQNYTASMLTQTISGKVLSSGIGLAGVTLLVNGIAVTSTDANGAYVITVNRGSTSTVTPQKAGYAFTPATKTYPDLSTDQTAQDYEATVVMYTISGTVTLNGNGLADVGLYAGTDLVATTNASGGYSFSKPYGWSSTVTPQKAGYVFTPATKTYSALTADQTAQDYNGAVLTYTISGTVKYFGGPLPAVNITVDGVTVATTDMNGAYSFPEPIGWGGVAIPVKAGYTFTPETLTYANLANNVTGQDYAAHMIMYTVSGMVTLNGAGLSGVGLYVSSTLVVTTGPNGAYSFQVPSGWSGVITPKKTGYAFMPVSRPYTNLAANSIGQDYVAMASVTYTISGTVTLSGYPLSEVVMIADGATVATTNSNGVYSFSKPAGWNGTVTPQKNGYGFTPETRTYTGLAADHAGQDYAAGPPMYKLSGRVWHNGAGMGGVPLIGNGDVVATTEADGTYSFAVPVGWNGTVNPVLAGYTFTPATRTYVVLPASQTNQDFTALELRATISGTVSSGGVGVQGVELYIGSSLMATTRADGVYSFTAPIGWSGTVYPVKTGYTFTPATLSYDHLAGNMTDQNYDGYQSVFELSGTVRQEIAGTLHPVPGVTITLSTGEQALTNEEGVYQFYVGMSWNGTVTATKPGFTLDPDLPLLVTPVIANSVQDFTAAPVMLNIAGRVTLATDPGTAITPNTRKQGVAGVSMRNAEGSVLATTNRDGYYTIEVTWGWTGSIRPVKDSYSFRPKGRDYANIGVDMDGQDYDVLSTGTVRH